MSFYFRVVLRKILLVFQNEIKTYEWKYFRSTIKFIYVPHRNVTWVLFNLSVSSSLIQDAAYIMLSILIPCNSVITTRIIILIDKGKRHFLLARISQVISPLIRITNSGCSLLCVPMLDVFSNKKPERRIILLQNSVNLLSGRDGGDLITMV